jgi:non-specific serine/threonine protein kinase/serine/threonine-protein kinase
MEYVAGESVSVYANSHSLDLRERLALFLTVCEAVAAAHRQLVIHGDIKPANILIGADGLPKLLDFGLARIIRPAASDVTMSMVLLTPGYASPEQVRGARLTTATDIYSLGVLLFELLTGESPYGEVTGSPLELCRAICDHAPRKPSTAAHKAIPGFAPRQLRGDLDHIVVKALRKSPDERYGTVDELRTDIQRYLDGFPVEAARGSVLYHLRKFVVRRRLLVVFGALLLVLASFAIWRIWRAEQMAELRFNQLRQFAHAMVFDVHDSIKELPGSTAARKMLIERSLQYLKGLETTSGQNRDLKLELARTYTKIGTVQASSASSSLEDCAAGIQNLEHARSLLRDILVRSDTDEEAALALVDADFEAADVHALRGEMREWRSLRSEATDLLNRVAARHPEKYSLRLRALTSVANTLDGEHNPAAALKAYEKVMDAASHAPSDPDTRLLLARTERNIAEELQALGDKRAALDHQRAALRIFQALLATSPGNTRFRLETSWAYTETGCVEHEFHDERGAMADFDRAMQLLRDMAAADPRNQLARLEIGKLEMAAASTVELAVSPQRAAENYRDALSIFAEALKLDSTNDDVRVNMAQGEFFYGDLQVRMAHGRCSAGIDSYRRALETASAVKDDYPATSVFDMRKLREELQRRLAACGPASAM